MTQKTESLESLAAQRRAALRQRPHQHAALKAIGARQRELFVRLRKLVAARDGTCSLNLKWELHHAMHHHAMAQTNPTDADLLVEHDMIRVRRIAVGHAV